MDFQSAMETFAEAWVAANTQTPLTEAAEAQLAGNTGSSLIAQVKQQKLKPLAREAAWCGSCDGILLGQASLGSGSSNTTLHELTVASSATPESSSAAAAAGSGTSGGGGGRGSSAGRDAPTSSSASGGGDEDPRPAAACIRSSPVLCGAAASVVAGNASAAALAAAAADFRTAPNSKTPSLSSMMVITQEGKSIPVHCVVEQSGGQTHGSPSQQQGGCPQGTEPSVELDSYAIVPSSTLFSDLVRTALIRLGYSSSEVIGAKGAIQIKNWRPLTFDQITDSSEATVGDILGELTTVATLRIRLYSRPKVNAASEVKEKLLQVLLAQSQSLLLSSGCPIDQSILAALSKGRLECDISEDVRKKFDQWYLQQVFHHCRQVVLHQQQQQAQQAAAQQQQQQQQAAQQQQQQQQQQQHGLDLGVVVLQGSSPPRGTGPCPPVSSHHTSHHQNRTRIRTSFDPELELPKLHQWFSENQHPSRMQIQGYVRELNALESRRGRKPLDVNNVVYWFKNARAAYKRAEQRYCPDSNGLRSPYSESAGENQSHSERYDQSSLRMITAGSPTEVCVGVQSVFGALDSAGEEHMEDSEPAHTLDLSIKKHVQRNGQEESDQRAGSSDDDKLTMVKEEPRDSSSEQSMDSGSESCDEDENVLGTTEDYSDDTIQRHNIENSNAGDEVQNGFEGRMGGNNNADSASSKGALVLCLPSPINCLEERRKRNRTFIDPVTEVPRLEHWFSSNTHPGHSQIVRYTQELNSMPYRQKYPKLEPKNIQFWFKNRRAKCKRLNLASFHHQNGVERLVQTAM